MSSVVNRLRALDWGRWRMLQAGLVAVAFVLLLLVPLTGNQYWLRVLTFIFMFGIMAEGWNLIGGFAGYTAFGQVAWFGLGSYSVAMGMTKYGWSFWPSLAVACLIPTVVAIVVGIPVLRLRGHYFAIATLALGIAIGALVDNLTFVGAASGLSLPIGPSFSYFYYLMFGALVLSVLVMWGISRSRFGYALFAIREGEQAASALGINTAYYKTMAFAISAGITGLAGGIYAYWTSFIDPPTVFNLVFNVDMIVMTLLGGIGTILGPVVGAFLLEGLNEVLGGAFLQLHAIIFAGVIIALVLFLPGGLSSLTTRKKFDLRTFIRNLKAYKV